MGFLREIASTEFVRERGHWTGTMGFRLRTWTWTWTRICLEKAYLNGVRKIIQILLQDGALLERCTENHTNPASRWRLAWTVYEKSYKSCFKMTSCLNVVRKIIQILLQDGALLERCTKNHTNPASRWRLAWTVYEKSYKSCFKIAPCLNVVRKIIQFWLQEGALLKWWMKNHTKLICLVFSDGAIRKITQVNPLAFGEARDVGEIGLAARSTRTERIHSKICTLSWIAKPVCNLAIVKSAPVMDSRRSKAKSCTATRCGKRADFRHGPERSEIESGSIL